MKSLVRSTLAAIAAGVTLAGCASYDYGSGYTYAQPYNGYNYGDDYDNGAYSYDYSPYYYDYGPSGYLAPSVGLGFTYRDRDRGNYDRNYNWHRGAATGHDNDYGRSDNDQWRGDHSRAVAPPPAQAPGRADPWGGTNKPYDPSWQQ